MSSPTSSIQQGNTGSATRIPEIDWLRCWCILLVFTFHITFIESQYAVVYDIVQLFHVPVFLLISGYLAAAGNEWHRVVRRVAKFGLWYLVFEGLYILMSAFLPVRDGIEHLTPLVFLDCLLLHPKGIYWYLHSLCLFSLGLSFCTSLRRMAYVNRLLLFLALCYLASRVHIVSFTNAVYFTVGSMAFRLGWNIWKIRINIISTVLLSFFVWFESHALAPNPLSSGLFVLCALLALLWAYGVSPISLQRLCAIVGRNTLPIMLFSPFFTFAAKFLQPYFCRFDPSNLLLLLFTLVVGCAFSIWLWQGFHRLLKKATGTGQ